MSQLVTFRPESMSAFLEEATRAYIKGGMPSGAIRCVIRGLRSAADTVTGEDRDCILSALVVLGNVVESIQKQEEERYK